ncbi:hypothetical protein AOLI_G00167910 [Acnodon oligacanthus]
MLYLTPLSSRTYFSGCSSLTLRSRKGARKCTKFFVVIFEWRTKPLVKLVNLRRRETDRWLNSTLFTTVG